MGHGIRLFYLSDKQPGLNAHFLRRRVHLVRLPVEQHFSQLC